jgi:hypothetical protein
MAERFPKPRAKHPRAAPALGANEAARRLWDLGLVIRMQAVTSGATLRALGDATGVHPETVRRYLTDGRPSAFFLAGLCRMTGVSPSWLLLGRAEHGASTPPGPMTADDEFVIPLSMSEPKLNDSPNRA